ncbi:sugar kinase, partial [Streptomyces sp. 7G]|nr:sugar kinase [Streptomyces sp. 7G]
MPGAGHLGAGRHAVPAGPADAADRGRVAGGEPRGRTRERDARGADRRHGGRPVNRPAAGGGLLVVGEVVTDVVARYGSALAHGTDTSARIRTLPGGAGANVACWAVRSGCADVRLLARAGAGSADWH